MNLIALSIKKSGNLLFYSFMFLIVFITLLFIVAPVTDFLFFKFNIFFIFVYLFNLRKSENNSLLAFIHRQSDNIFSSYLKINSVELLISLLFGIIAMLFFKDKVIAEDFFSFIIIYYMVVITFFTIDLFTIYNYSELASILKNLLLALICVSIYFGNKTMLILVLLIFSLFIFINTITFPNKSLAKLNHFLGYRSIFYIQKIYRIEIVYILFIFIVFFLMMVFVPSHSLNLKNDTIAKMIIFKTGVCLNILYLNVKVKFNNSFITQLNSFPNTKKMQFKLIFFIIAVEFLALLILSLHYSNIPLYSSFQLLVLSNSIPLLTSIFVRNWIGTINNENNPRVYLIIDVYIGIMFAYGLINATINQVYIFSLMYFISGIAFILYMFLKEKREIILF